MLVARTRFIAFMLLFAGILSTTSVTHAQSASCQCLVYFQRDRGLPPTGSANFAAADYYNFLSSYKGSFAPRGYNLERISPSTSNPRRLEGAGMIWARNSQGAGGAGHIATVTKATYDSKSKRWRIEFRDANGWMQPTGRLFNSSGCSNVAVRRLETSSLNGLTFFKWSRK